MKVKLWALAAIFILCGLAAVYDAWYTPTAILARPPEPAVNSDVAPDFSFQTYGGNTYHLRGLTEKGVVLHFWASWCAPCIAEFPVLLEKIHNAHGNLALVAVSIDDDRSAMDSFITRLQKQMGGNGEDTHVYWVWDEKKDISLKTFSTADVPETILIDSRRRMIDKIAGNPGWLKIEQAARLDAIASGKN